MENNEKYGVKPTEAKQTANKTMIHEIFQLVKLGTRVKITIPGYQVSAKDFKTFTEAKAYIDKKPWELIINTTAALNELQNLKKLTNK